MIARDQVLAAVDAVVGRRGAGGGRSFTADDVVAELTLTLGYKVPERDVRGALRDLAGEVRLYRAGYRLWYERYAPEMRAAWREADELAGALGGEADHYIMKDRPATVTLTLERARVLVALLAEALK